MSTDTADKPGTSTRVRSTGGVRRREEDVVVDITEGTVGHCPGSQGATGDEAVQGERVLRRERDVERELSLHRELTLQRDIVRACAVCLALMFAIFAVRTVDRVMDCDSNDNATKVQANCDHLTLERDQLKSELYQFKREKDEERAVLCSVSCPTGWQKFGCSCYYRFTGEKTWDESREQCQEEKGAHLVVINGEEEQVFVGQLNSAGSGAAWIGLNKTERGWMWVDGTPTTGYWVHVSFNKWTDSEDMNCAEYSKGAWSHSLCSNERAWICEKPLIKV